MLATIVTFATAHWFTLTALAAGYAGKIAQDGAVTKVKAWAAAKKLQAEATEKDLKDRVAALEALIKSKV